MNDNHITRLEVRNFKKFDHLVVENIGQVNLITGDNNVGKTSLLELLLWEPNMKQILSVIAHSLEGRKINVYDRSKIKFPIGKEVENQTNNLIGLVQKNKHKPIDVLYKIDDCNSIGFFITNEIIDVRNNDVKDSNIKKFVESVDLFGYDGINELSKNWLIFYKNNQQFNKEKPEGQTYEVNYMVDVTSSYYFDFMGFIDYVPLVRIDDLYQYDIIDFADEVTKTIKEKEYLLQLLNSVFPQGKIKLLETKNIQGNNILCIATDAVEKFHPVTYYGDGFVRTVRIILEIILCKNRRLMIDEVEVGLHFIKQKELWLAILKAAKDNDVQLFCTTHSQECIKAFITAAEEVNEIKDDIRLIELEEAKSEKSDRNIFASTYNFEQIKAGLYSDVNLRGGTD